MCWLAQVVSTLLGKWLVQEGVGGFMSRPRCGLFVIFKFMTLNCVVTKLFYASEDAALLVHLKFFSLVVGKQIACRLSKLHAVLRERLWSLASLTRHAKKAPVDTPNP